MQPKARYEDLLVQPVGDELVIYDRQLQRAHHLNRAATLVWRRCDGRTSIPAIAQLVARDLHVPADEPATWLALARLERAQLLQDEKQPAARPDVSRREVLRRLGSTGAVLLPVITSIAAPPAQAATSRRLGQGGSRCKKDSDCCSNRCVPEPFSDFGTCARSRFCDTVVLPGDS